MTDVLTTPVAVLMRLRELLVRDGWLKRFPGGLLTRSRCPPNDDGRGWCPHDAIVRMMATSPARTEAIRRLADGVNGKTSVDFLRWNDAPERKKGDVLALIDRVAA